MESPDDADSDRFLLRRAAVRSLSASPTSFAVSSSSVSRTFVTRASIVGQVSQRQQSVHVLRRWASDEASPVKEETSGETVPSEPSKAEAEAEAKSEAEAEADEAPLFQKTVSAAHGAANRIAEATGLSFNRNRESNAEDDSGVFKAPKPSKILYVGNLFFEVDADTLQREFATFGTVTNCRIAQDARGLSRGFGYVEFSNLADATLAMESLDQKPLQGRRMAVQYHVRREPRSTSVFKKHPESGPTKTIFIGNMSFQMTDKDLNNLFREVKNVTDVRVAIDRRSGQPRGFAHADFIDVESAQKAKDYLEGKEIYGRQLRVDFTKTQTSGR